jgi:hypothetical protein
MLDVWLPDPSGRNELAGWYIAVHRPFTLEVQDFFVKPAFRGRGEARKMADYLAGMARFSPPWQPQQGAEENVSRLMGLYSLPLRECRVHSLARFPGTRECTRSATHTYCTRI